MLDHPDRLEISHTPRGRSAMERDIIFLSTRDRMWQRLPRAPGNNMAATRRNASSVVGGNRNLVANRSNIHWYLSCGPSLAKTEFDI